jgi:DNA-binding transcriptional LysR family regulator
MFSRLFADSGLSLDRLRALVEVGASGSIVRASAGDPVRQSQYSRQIKELEDFFQTRLVERQGKGVRLTASGRELARISRFFLLGLSNFQRGCLSELQTFRIGASVTAVQHLLMPILAGSQAIKNGPRYDVEVVRADEIERRLHDLTLDFAMVTAETLSRPLQVKEIGSWWLRLWVPRGLCRTERSALQALDKGELPVVTARESRLGHGTMDKCQPLLTCESFIEALAAVEQGTVGALLPDYLRPLGGNDAFLRVDLPVKGRLVFTYNLAWNPRLMRLNAHAVRTRDRLTDALAARMKALERY